MELYRDDDWFEVESFLLNVLLFYMCLINYYPLKIINGENIYNVRNP